MVLSNRVFGREAEDRAATWYSQAGYRILERNWRTARGEIDLVCLQDDLLVLCEVKARRSDRNGIPAEAVTASKQRRLRQLAAAYASGSAAHYSAIRFDVVSVLGPELTVIEGAF